MAVEETVNFPLYRTFDVEQVPETPGVYAWFYRRPFFAQQPAEQILDLIRGSSDSTRPSAIGLTSTSVAFGSRWTGEIKLEGTESDRGVELFLHELNENDRARTIGHLNNIVKALLPLLYIGKADTLRSRLRQHIRLINLLSENKTPTGLVGDEIEDANFAERLLSRRISVDHIRFTYFEFPEGNSQSRTDCEANKFVESVVNHSLRPILGKR